MSFMVKAVFFICSYLKNETFMKDIRMCTKEGIV